MKKVYFVAALFVIGVVIALGQGSSLILAPGGLLSQCPGPVTGSKALIQCNVAGDRAGTVKHFRANWLALPIDGLYVSANGSPLFQVQAPQAQGVSSFNTRTGAVKPAANDYAYSQLSGPPTTVTCTTFSVTNGSLTASGCTIK